MQERNRAQDHEGCRLLPVQGRLPLFHLGQINGKKLTDEHIRQLVTKGRTGLIKGFKKKDGTSTYDACLVLPDDFKVRLEFEGHAKAAKTA